MNKNLKNNKDNIYRVCILYWMVILILILSGVSQGSEVEDNFLEEDEEIIADKVIDKDVCFDEAPKCIDNQKRKEVNNLSISRDCWKYAYTKKCNKIPSKNDCNVISPESYNLKYEDCLVTTNISGREFCLNIKKTFSHTYKQTEEIDKTEIIMDPDNNGAVKELLCESLCLDGNCSSVFKSSQETNNEISSAIAQLEMLSEIKKGLKDANELRFDIFGAEAKRCHNKTKFHSNCCINSGMMKSAGLVKCSTEQISLASEVRKGKCVPVGDYCAKKVAGICLRKTYTYCCFPTVLAKTIRLAGRDQLGKNLGTPKNPQCGGLTINDIEALDFNKIDFTEFFEREVQPRIKNYNLDDNEALMKRSFVDINNEGVNEKSFEVVDEGR